MATEFTLPGLAEGVESVEVVRVLVSAGDTVAIDQPVIEVETDKATAEVPCSVAGVVAKVHVKEGDQVSVGQVVLTVDEAAVKKTTARTSQKQESPEPQKTAPVETSPPKVMANAAPPREEALPKTPEAFPETAAATTGWEERPAMPEVPAAPSVRRFAREIGINIARVPGTGPNGRISVEDVKRYAKQVNEALAEGAASGIPPVPPLPDFAHWGPVRREPMDNFRRRTAEHMVLAWTQIPHVTQFDTADVTELDELRKRFAAKAEKAGGKLTLTAMVAKVAASALKVFPRFNASVDMARREVIFKQYCNIGIATATERGLLVPVIKDVDRKNMLDIASELGQLAEKARDRKIRPDELEGGTFTISNLGNIGGSHFTPIINYPEVAILGVGRARLEPGFKETVCQPKLVLPLSLSYDHRVIDGAEAITFLRWIVDALEEPLLLSLEG